MKKRLRAEYEKRRLELSGKRETDWSDLKIDDYARAVYYDAISGSELLYDAINNSLPFFVCRLGETELRMIRLMKLDSWQINRLRISTYDVCNNAGFFPRKIGHIRRFCDVYLDSAYKADYLGIMLWQDEEYFMSKSDNLKGSFSAGILDPIYMDDNKWLEALEDKKVLVISPFKESILEQYKKRDELFRDKAILREFDLKVIKAVQSIGGRGAEGFMSWFDALEHMKQEISEIDFDIALLGCGAYGVPLGAYIRDIGKKAIYVGGCLQLLFGIVGKRWENQDYVRRYLNENWVRPMNSERPESFNRIEDGCYW